MPQRPDQPTPTWQPISQLPLIASLIDGVLIASLIDGVLNGAHRPWLVPAACVLGVYLLRLVLG